MATITKVRRKSGYAYKACIRLRGIKPFSKTYEGMTLFRLSLHGCATVVFKMLPAQVPCA